MSTEKPQAGALGAFVGRFHGDTTPRWREGRIALYLTAPLALLPLVRAESTYVGLSRGSFVVGGLALGLSVFLYVTLVSPLLLRFARPVEIWANGLAATRALHWRAREVRWAEIQRVDIDRRSHRVTLWGDGRVAIASFPWPLTEGPRFHEALKLLLRPEHPLRHLLEQEVR